MVWQRPIPLFLPPAFVSHCLSLLHRFDFAVREEEAIHDYRVKLEIFEGPLDLLLHLIKKEEVDIYDVSLERITGQYMSYIETFKLLNIDLASEFIVMAANLMYLKSRTLLPRQELPPEEQEDEQDPRLDLIRQLVEYKKFKDAASFLFQKEAEQADIFAHAAEALDPALAPDAPPEPLPDVNIFDLIRAFNKVLTRFEESHELGDIVDDRFTVSDKIDALRELLPPGQGWLFHDLFSGAISKSEVIVTFLAVLELMKMNQFAIQQDHVLGDIEILRKS